MAWSTPTRSLSNLFTGGKKKKKKKTSLRSRSVVKEQPLGCSATISQKTAATHANTSCATRSVGGGFSSAGAASSSPQVNLIPYSDMVAEQCLGMGAFASVHSVNSLCYDDSSDHFAVKRLHENTLKCPSLTRAASHDLVAEVNILTQLSVHQNIVTLHAVSDNFFESPSEGFMILEKLVETLEERLGRWRSRKEAKEKKAPPKGVLAAQFSTKQPYLMSFSHQKQRLSVVGLGLARALAYLHQNMILYRDLKVGNVGFDRDGNVQLFDFGLSRQIDPESNRKMTRFVGTPRYMSPEVASTHSYGFPADVYSFSILLWEVVTLEVPFSNAKNMQHLMQMVVVRDVRPNLRPVASKVIQDLLKRGWSPQMKLRPAMADIVNTLKQEVAPARHYHLKRKLRRSHSASDLQVMKRPEDELVYDRSLSHFQLFLNSSLASTDFDPAAAW